MSRDVVFANILALTATLYNKNGDEKYLKKCFAAFKVLSLYEAWMSPDLPKPDTIGLRNLLPFLQLMNLLNEPPAQIVALCDAYVTTVVLDDQGLSPEDGFNLAQSLLTPANSKYLDTVSRIFREMDMDSDFGLGFLCGMTAGREFVLRLFIDYINGLDLSQNDSKSKKRCEMIVEYMLVILLAAGEYEDWNQFVAHPVAVNLDIDIGMMFNLVWNLRDHIPLAFVLKLCTVLAVGDTLKNKVLAEYLCTLVDEDITSCVFECISALITRSDRDHVLKYSEYIQRIILFSEKEEVVYAGAVILSKVTLAEAKAELMRTLFGMNSETAYTCISFLAKNLTVAEIEYLFTYLKKYFDENKQGSVSFVFECIGNVLIERKEAAVWHLGIDFLFLEWCDDARRVLRLLAKGSMNLDILWSRLLECFMTSASSEPQQQPSLFEILQLLAVLSTNQNFVVDFSDKQRDEIRDVWMYLVLYEYVPNRAWPDAWLSSLQAFAFKTPAFVMKKAGRYLEVELENCVAFKFMNFKHEKNIQEYVEWLIPGNDKLSIKVASYFLSIYEVEKLKTRRDTMESILMVLADDRLSQYSALLESFTNEVIKSFVKNRTRSQDFDALKEFVKCMLGYCISRLSRVRDFCIKKIKYVLDLFPQFLWDDEIVKTVLSMYETMTDAEFIWKEQDLVKKDVFSFLSSWFDRLVDVSEDEAIGLLQSFVFAKKKEKDVEYLVALLDRVGKDKGFVSKVISRAVCHSAHLGKVSVIDGNVPEKLKKKLTDAKEQYLLHRDIACLEEAVYLCGACIVQSESIDYSIVNEVCRLPHFSLEIKVFRVCLNVLKWISSIKTELSLYIFAEMIKLWKYSVEQRVGLDKPNVFYHKLTYTPSSLQASNEKEALLHDVLIEFIRDRFNILHQTFKEPVYLVADLIKNVFDSIHLMKFSSDTRDVIFKTVYVGLKAVEALMQSKDVHHVFLRYYCYRILLSWFGNELVWGDGSKDSVRTVTKLLSKLRSLPSDRQKYPEEKYIEYYAGFKHDVKLKDVHELLTLLVEHEGFRLFTWFMPLNKEKELHWDRKLDWPRLVKTAWASNPKVALFMADRFVGASHVINHEVSKWVCSSPIEVCDCEVALKYLEESGNERDLQMILLWTPMNPITSISLLSKEGIDKRILQYAMKSLESFPADLVFFYVPQMVQALRYDRTGYVEKYILDTAKSSQLFAHQIIWNMKANMFKDGEGEEPDDLKEHLESIIEKITSSLSGPDKEFYEREFKFFGQVTGISGKLKPYITKSKPEKKKKIDEELRKIKVEVGVYLPSNPESIVVDIDYDSGRPLQSHAKAPFMATFKIKKLIDEKSIDKSTSRVLEETSWQSAIFKVGDDCRQDILALQLIGIFKTIFMEAGLDLYVFPYRVVATDPGCGIIEVIPKSISRDMIGREVVNNLYDYFVQKFGSTESVAYCRAQYNFIKSLAAYSLIMYLLQIKDRHNGNIMIDNDGHIVHIDFGFILDISPGGINFESCPFKLTTEMIAILGGSQGAEPYKAFTDMVIRAYLASRKYADEIVEMVRLMADSSLPCFKSEATITKLRDRFQLGKTEKGAAEFMFERVRESHENSRSKLYDGFQYLQNGIPY